MYTKIYGKTTTSTQLDKVVLQSESVLKSPPQDGIHEGQVSLTHGFVPFQAISPSLPEKYKAWEELSKNLPRYISEGSEREHIKELPLLDATDVEQLPNEHLSRSIAIIGNLAHAYYYNQRLGQDQSTDPLPESILIPWQELTKRIHRKLPPNSEEGIQAVRIHYDTFLTNWQLNKEFHIDGVHNSDLKLKDLTILSPIFGNPTEYHFNMTFVIMELRFAQALQHMTDAIKAVAEKDDEALIKALEKITLCIEDVTNGLDYINPNQHSESHVDPTVWTKTVAKIDGKVPGGISGLSGSAMPLFHTLDAFIERGSYSSTMGKAMVTKYKHQPEYIQRYLTALRDDLSKYSIRDYIAKSSNPILKNQYDLMIASYLSEDGLMGIHALKVYGYMKINFRNGRLLTNGGHDGTSTIATEPQRDIYDDFAQADQERYSGYQSTQQYATKIHTKVYTGKAAAIDLDVSKTALHFQPGDHCAIYPENSTRAISLIVDKYSLDPFAKIEVSARWKEYLIRHTNLSAEKVTLGDLLKHADLNLFKSAPFVLDDLKPLMPRYYSVSPLSSSPQHIRLTVGMHEQGIASTYLMSDVPKFAIDRIPARHFHLPKNKETPVLMFAAGTGISPFMGFIDERAQYSDKSKNMLFLSTPTVDAFYHQEELGKAVAANQIDLSVIFSRGNDYDSGRFTTSGFETTNQYKGKHIDQLILEQAEKIADLIVNQNAHIYICGNPGFADTVRTAMIKILSNHKEIENPCDYVDTMIADFRFNMDVYAAPNYNQQYRSIPASELALHNKPENCWGVINGSVYDLTRFIHIHPGGQKIVLVNGGMDMSGDYNYIKHNQRPQIEGLLQQYKIGVLGTPAVHSDKATKLYGQCKKFTEALTEMENTLRNNTTHEVKGECPYLWREVYSVFVDGSLASYRKPGSGSAGSLNYVLGPLLKELCAQVQLPTQELDEGYLKLMANASECGNAVRMSAIGPLSESEMQMKKKIFDMVLQQTFKFIAEVKALSLDVLKEIEVHGDEYNEEIMADKLGQIVKLMAVHSGLLKHITTQLPKLDKPVPYTQDMSSGGCVFAKQVQESKPESQKPQTEALCTFGLMAQPKAKPSSFSFIPDSVKSSCTLI